MIPPDKDEENVKVKQTLLIIACMMLPLTTLSAFIEEDGKTTYVIDFKGLTGDKTVTNRVGLLERLEETLLENVPRETNFIINGLDRRVRADEVDVTLEGALSIEGELASLFFTYRLPNDTNVVTHASSLTKTVAFERDERLYSDVKAMIRNGRVFFVTPSHEKLSEEFTLIEYFATNGASWIADSVIDSVSGKLIVRSPVEGAELFVDDVNLGNTGQSMVLTSSCPKGRHTVSIRKLIFPTYTVELEIEPGKTYELAPDNWHPGTYRIATKPSEANIFIDGVLVGTSPKTVDMEAGRHRLTALKDDLQEIVDIEVAEGVTNELFFEMFPRFTGARLAKGARVGVIVSGYKDPQRHLSYFSTALLNQGYVPVPIHPNNDMLPPQILSWIAETNRKPYSAATGFMGEESIYEVGFYEDEHVKVLNKLLTDNRALELLDVEYLVIVYPEDNRENNYLVTTINLQYFVVVTFFSEDYEERMEMLHEKDANCFERGLDDEIRPLYFYEHIAALYTGQSIEIK